MDLFSKAVIFALILIAFMFSVYYIESHGVAVQQITKSQPDALVLNYLQNSNPSSAINITNTTPSHYPGSWHITASIVTNATSPCPSYFIYSFDYPKYGFVLRVDNTYTSNCQIYGSAQGKSAVIGSYPVAITKSYVDNISAVKAFVYKYGFSNVSAHAFYFNSTAFQGKEYSNLWIVNYTSSKSNASVDVLLSQSNGTVLYISS